MSAAAAPRTEELVPSVSIENLIQKRDAMVERVREALRLFGEADTLADAMFGGEESQGRRRSGYNRLDVYLGHNREICTIEKAIKLIDSRAWEFLLAESGLQTFLDAEARKQWDDAIDKLDVPELNHDTIAATFSALYSKRGEMFENGVVAVFKALSWDYRTNNPVMFGKRIILRYLVDTWGTGGQRYVSGVSHTGANRLDDLIRVMSVLDGKPEPDHRNGAWHTLSGVEWMRNGSDCNVATLGGFFTVKGFKNGNGHLTFLDPHLVDKMNRIIAKHFPHALPPASE